MCLCPEGENVLPLLLYGSFSITKLALCSIFQTLVNLNNVNLLWGCRSTFGQEENLRIWAHKAKKTGHELWLYHNGGPWDLVAARELKAVESGSWWLSQISQVLWVKAEALALILIRLLYQFWFGMAQQRNGVCPTCNYTVTKAVSLRPC